MAIGRRGRGDRDADRVLGDRRGRIDDPSSGTGRDQVAPTISDVIGFRRPFPGVRAGVAVNGVATGARPRLVLKIALKGSNI